MFFKRRNRIFCACRHLGGGGALLRNLSDNSAHSDASLSGQNATENLTPQEQLLAGTLELDPENGPVIYTTDYGLEIRSHNAGMPPVSVTNPNDAPITVSSTSWNYISAGGYNWIIIGSYSESSYTISTIRGDEYSGSNPDGTDAGYESERAGTNGLLKINPITIPAFSNAKEGYNGEIPIGCVLCLSAGNITTTNLGNTNIYYSEAGVSSNLRTSINDNIYPLVKDLPIVPQPLTTAGSASTTEYLFPLASTQRATTESFAVENYLDSNTKCNLGAYWWLRSSYAGASYSPCMYCIAANGSVYNNGNNSLPFAVGVRPAFVLQLYSA